MSDDPYLVLQLRGEVERLQRELFDREAKLDAYALREQELERALRQIADPRQCPETRDGIMELAEEVLKHE